MIESLAIASLALGVFSDNEEGLGDVIERCLLLDSNEPFMNVYDPLSEEEKGRIDDQILAWVKDVTSIETLGERLKILVLLYASTSELLLKRGRPFPTFGGRPIEVINAYEFNAVADLDKLGRRINNENVDVLNGLEFGHSTSYDVYAWTEKRMLLVERTVPAPSYLDTFQVKLYARWLPNTVRHSKKALRSRLRQAYIKRKMEKP